MTRSPWRPSRDGLAGTSPPRAWRSCPPAVPTGSAATSGGSAPPGTGARLAGLYDAGEEHIVRRGLAAAGLTVPGRPADLERLGFFCCVADLEDELIRAAGPALATELFAAHGDLRAFRTIQRQPAWRGRDEAAQLRRFLGAGGQRKSRYARLLTEAVGLDQVPRPLAALLAGV